MFSGFDGVRAETTSIVLGNVEAVIVVSTVGVTCPEAE